MCFGLNICNAESFLTTLVIIGVVIIVSALLSGLIERSGTQRISISSLVKRSAASVSISPKTLTNRVRRAKNGGSTDGAVAAPRREVTEASATFSALVRMATERAGSPCW